MPAVVGCGRTASTFLVTLLNRLCGMMLPEKGCPVSGSKIWRGRSSEKSPVRILAVGKVRKRDEESVRRKSSSEKKKKVLLLSWLYPSGPKTFFGVKIGPLSENPYSFP